jgi:hypothetical protein
MSDNRTSILSCYFRHNAAPPLALILGTPNFGCRQDEELGGSLCDGGNLCAVVLPMLAA